MQDGYTGRRPGLFGEAERAAVEGNALRKARYVDADGNGSGHWVLCRPTLSRSAAGRSPVRCNAVLDRRFEWRRDQLWLLRCHDNGIASSEGLEPPPPPCGRDRFRPDDLSSKKNLIAKTHSAYASAFFCSKDPSGRTRLRANITNTQRLSITVPWSWCCSTHVQVTVPSSAAKSWGTTRPNRPVNRRVRQDPQPEDLAGFRSRGRLGHRRAPRRPHRFRSATGQSILRSP